MALRSKDKNPFAPDQVGRATRTFACELGTIHKGDYFKGGDAIVEHAWTAFVPGDTLDRDLENMWEAMPEPPQHAPHIIIQSVDIPVWRQVVCTQDVSARMSYARGSEGERLQREGRIGGPPFARTLLRRGQILDALSPEVRQHPGFFRWPEREVTHEDVERLERLEALEPRGAMA